MTLPTPMKIVIALFVTTLIGLGFWLIDWQKKTAEIKQLSTALTQKEQEHERCISLTKAMPMETQRKKELARQLREVVQDQLPVERQNEMVASYISDVEKLALQQQTRMGDPDFQITSLTPGPETRTAGKGEGSSILKDYPTRTFQMQFVGRYSSVVDFLRQLGALKLKRLVTIDRITLTPSGDLSHGSPPLAVGMPITAYLRPGAAD
jgi:Tfp pilus assembly protein PilO